MIFKTYTREPDFLLCEECWDEKIERGNKKHNSYLQLKKHFKPKCGSGQR